MPHPWEQNWIEGERIGKGGQGFTHHATRVDQPDLQAVLKKLKNNKDPKARRRMHREVVNLDLLHKDGANVPAVLDDNTDKYEELKLELYAVIEFIAGPTLMELVEQRGPLSLELAANLTKKICDTIRIAHEVPVLHRDLKPDNIIVRDFESADVVIIDYGLSFNAIRDEPVTETGETFRNKFLDLPETVTPGGNRRDPRSDVTAACGVFYYCLTGHVPGQLGGSDGQPPHMRPGYSVREIMPDDQRVSQLELLFSQGFLPNIDARFQSVTEFVERMEFAVFQAPTGVIENPRDVAERESRRLRQGDRQSQLNEFAQPAQKLLQRMRVYAQQHQRMNTFHVSEQSAKAAKKLPSLDVVANTIRVQLNAAGHQMLRIAEYAVGSRGEQCCLLRRELKRGRRESGESVVSDWQETYWFEGASDPDPQPAIRELQQWLNSAMSSLTDDILTSPPPPPD